MCQPSPRPLGECGREHVFQGNKFSRGPCALSQKRTEWKRTENKRSESKPNTVLHYFCFSDVFSFNFPAPGNKKRSNRAQNDYEMADSIASERSVSTLPSSRDNKDAIISIPEGQRISEQLPVTKVLPQDEPEEGNNLVSFEKGEVWISLSWLNEKRDSWIVLHQYTLKKESLNTWGTVTKLYHVTQWWQDHVTFCGVLVKSSDWVTTVWNSSGNFRRKFRKEGTWNLSVTIA